MTDAPEARDTGWAWWAGGRVREDFDLAGPCASRDEAISEAHGSDWYPGDRFFVEEAIVANKQNEYGLYHVFARRNFEDLEFKP